MRKDRKTKPENHRHPLMETLEERCLLSASVAPVDVPAAQAQVMPAITLPQTASAAAKAAIATPATQPHLNRAGVISAVDATAGTLSISATLQGQTTDTDYTISPTARVVLNGRAATTDDLVDGMSISVRTDKANPTTVTVIRASVKQITGSVTAIDTTNNTITITYRHGTITITVSPDAKINVDGKSGALTDVTVGSKVKLGLSATDKTVAITADVDTTPKMDDGQVHSERVYGAVVSVDTTADTITVATTRAGATTNTTYTLSATATITVDGAAATLDQLTSGVKVSLMTDPTDPATVTAVTAVGTEVEGRVTAVDAVNNTITVSGHDGSSPAIYTLTTTTPITINGATGSLSAVTVGSEAHIRLSALNSANVVSVNVGSGRRDRFDGGQGLRDEMGFVQHNVFGSVASVDTTLDTVTLNINRHGTSTQSTYTLSPTATITADGSAITLNQLNAGEKVDLRLDPTTSAVTAITAVAPRAEGVVTAVDTTNGTVTITSRREGSPTTYTIPAAATITIDGAAGSLAGVTVGSEVELNFSAQNPATITAVHVETAGREMERRH